MASGGQTSDAVADDRDRFIAVRKSDILQALIGDGRLADGEREKFLRLCRQLGAIYHYDYLDRLETLRNDYYYFNPDLPHDTPVGPAVLAQAHDELVATLIGVLRSADFVEVAPEDVERSHHERHFLKVAIETPLEHYREVRYFRRGCRRTTMEIREWFGLRKRKIEADVYDHLVLMVMIKPADELDERLARQLARNRLRPGTILIKYFRDIARGDLNMLFPDVRVVMSLFDKFALGLPAIVGGIPIILNLLPTITVLFVVIGFYLGLSGAVQDDEMKAALAALSGLAALGGFLMRQWLKYQRQSLKYHKELSDNVYFRNINNNAGVFDALIGAAEERECKEAFLAYYFLAAAGNPIAQDALEEHVERWLEDRFKIDVAFEVGEALAKLERFKLLRRDGDRLSVLPIDQALAVLDRVWGNFFPVPEEAAP